MGFFIRKRKSFGPFALNFSTKGIGISTGVKGARLSVGPNGTFIHLGRHGVYYRKKIGGFSDKTKVTPRITNETNIASRIESADIKSFQDSSQDNLLSEITEKNSLIKYSTISWISSIIIFLIAISLGSPGWLNTFIILLSIGSYSYLFNKDVKRKTVTVIYELDKPVESAFKKLNKGFERFKENEKIWRIETQDLTDDWKRNSGASNLVNRKVLEINEKLPPFFNSNVIPNSFKIDDKTYYFFPDRILIFQGSEVGMIFYTELKLQSKVTRFIESEGVPSDSEIVDHNWRYINKNGGPDKRFSNNYQIPVVLYSEIDINTKSGINLKFQASNKNSGEYFISSFKDIGSLKSKK